jgi:hypothetical protein
VCGLSGFFYIWIDGRLVTYADSFRSLTYSGTITTIIGGTNLTTGAETIPLSWSDIRVFNRIPKQGEVIALMEGGVAIPANARYCVGSAITGADISGNGNNLTTVGTLSGAFTGRNDPPHIALNTTLSKWNLRGKRKTPGTGRLRMLPTSDVADASWLNELGTNTNMYASID